LAVVEFRSVDILFGRRQAEALTQLDGGASRDDILRDTGCVLGAAGVSLSIDRGEISVLMGLSGSGKSTLLRAVNRLNKVTRGQVLVEHEGRSIDIASCDETTLRAVRRGTVSTVFQQFALLPWRTVRENVGFGLELRGVSARQRSRVTDEKLAMVGLSQWADKYAHQLSGGMQQRVGLARAFATDAEILLMDEPFSALDPLIRDKLQDELLDLQRTLKKTIIFVSHDLDEAMKLGNHITILEGGRVVQTGTGEDILLHPANGYVAEFVRHMNPLKVLRCGAVMKTIPQLSRQQKSVLLDQAGRVRVELDDQDRPIAVTMDGRPGRFTLCDGSATDREMDQHEILVLSADLKLQTAIAVKRQTGHPILLVDQLGRMAGLCGDEEIYKSLLKR